MARVMSDTEWLRKVGALTVSPEGTPAGGDQVADAEELAGTLIALAKALPRCPDHAHDPSNPHTSCAFTDLPAGGRACSLADELAALPVPPGASDVEAGQDVAARFLQAVRDAAPAVYLCRRVHHVSGHCVFRHGGLDDDLCGRILALSHRL